MLVSDRVKTSIRSKNDKNFEYYIYLKFMALDLTRL